MLDATLVFQSPIEFRFYQQDDKPETTPVDLGSITNDFLSKVSSVAAIFITLISYFVHTQ